MTEDVFHYYYETIFKTQIQNETKQHLFHGTRVGSYAEVQRILFFDSQLILHIIYYVYAHVRNLIPYPKIIKRHAI